MDPLLQFLLALAVVVAAAKGSGYLSSRLGQPAVLGELAAGLVLGPTVLDMLHWPVFGDPHLAELLRQLAHLGVLFLMFIAGLDVELESLISAGRPAVLAGVMGVVAPVILGVGLFLLFGLSLEPALLLGLVLAATSVSISAQTLLELDVLRTRAGVTLLGAAVVDDVLVILLLSVFVALVAGGGGGTAAVLWTVVRMSGFLALAVVVGLVAVPRLAQLVDRLPISEGVMALAVVVTLLYAWAAEYLGGMASITGAFLTGAVFARTAVKRHLLSGMHTMAYAWLVPVFFVSIGLEANGRALGLEGLPFAGAIIVVAVVSKVVGCGAGAWLGGLSTRDSVRVGVGMSSRGEVGLIVANVGLGTGLLEEGVFAAVVLMVLATTLLTPALLRAMYPGPEVGKDRAEAVEA